MPPSHDQLIRPRLRADLLEAMAGGEQVRIRVIRTLLAAIDNASAVPTPSSAFTVVGYGDVPRRSMDRSEVEKVIGREIEERVTAAGEYRLHGKEAEAGILDEEVDILRGYLEE